MIKLTVGQMFACLQPIMAISRQEMNLEQAEKIANFVGAYIDVMTLLESKRAELLEIEWGNEAERDVAFNEFAQETKELPEINFKEFQLLKVTPDMIITLKRAGLYA